MLIQIWELKLRLSLGGSDEWVMEVLSEGPPPGWGRSLDRTVEVATTGGLAVQVVSDPTGDVLLPGRPVTELVSSVMSRGSPQGG